MFYLYGTECRHWVRRSASLFALFAFSMLALISSAEVFQVGTTAELRAALLAAQGNGANDEIVLSDGAYDITADGNSTLSFFDAEPFQLILRAATTGSAVLDGLGQARVLDIDSSAEVELLIQGLTIRNGKSADGGAGMQLNVQAAVIEQTKFLVRGIRFNLEYNSV